MAATYARVIHAIIPTRVRSDRANHNSMRGGGVDEHREDGEPPRRREGRTRRTAGREHLQKQERRSTERHRLPESRHGCAANAENPRIYPPFGHGQSFAKGVGKFYRINRGAVARSDSSVPLLHSGRRHAPRLSVYGSSWRNAK